MAASHGSLIAEFCAITDAQTDDARVMLEDSSWEMSIAVHRFYDLSEDVSQLAPSFNIPSAVNANIPLQHLQRTGAVSNIANVDGGVQSTNPINNNAPSVHENIPIPSAQSPTIPEITSLRCSYCHRVKRLNLFPRREHSKSKPCCIGCTSMLKEEFRELGEMLTKPHIGLPDEVCFIIFETLWFRYIPLYRPRDFHERTDVMEWNKDWNTMKEYVYGVSFKPTRNIECWGMQVFADFGNAITYSLMRICHEVRSRRDPSAMVEDYKHLKATMNPDEDGQQFIFEDHETVLIPKGKECRIGFVLSEDAELTMYSENKEMKGSPEITDLKWTLFEKETRNTRVNGKNVFEDVLVSASSWVNSKITWSPLMRLLY